MREGRSERVVFGGIRQLAQIALDHPFRLRTSPLSKTGALLF
jgi:hypothetical protein